LNASSSATPHHSGYNDTMGSPSAFTDEPETLASTYPSSDMFPSSHTHHSTSRNAKHIKRPASPDYDNVSYAGSRPSSRRTSIQLHFQEPRSRRSSVRESTTGLGGNLANAGSSVPRRKGSLSNTPITRQYSRGNGTTNGANSVGVSRKGSINFASTPPISSPTLRHAGPGRGREGRPFTRMSGTMLEPLGSGSNMLLDDRRLPRRRTGRPRLDVGILCPIGTLTNDAPWIMMRKMRTTTCWRPATQMKALTTKRPRGTRDPLY
jgi:hypothetical protein